MDTITQVRDGILSRQTMATWAIWSYIIAFSAFSVTEIGDHLQLLGPIEEGVSLIGGVVALVASVIFLVSVVLVSRWIYRAHSNLRQAGYEGLEFTPGWAVGWFFIPIACLFKPFQAMRELFNISLWQSDSYAAPDSTLLKQWWGAWIVGNILSNVSARFTGVGSSAVLAVEIIANMVLIASAWFLLQIIKTVSDAQCSRLGFAETFA